MALRKINPAMLATQLTASSIADSAITTAKLADGAVATAKLADSAVTSLKVADGTIAPVDTTTQIATTGKALSVAIALG